MENSSKPLAQTVALTINYDLYARYLEDSDLTEDQKREFIETLWNIIVSFVDLGFGIHPLQQAASDECEQKRELGEFLTSAAAGMINSEDKSKPQFNSDADGPTGPSQERSRK